MKSNPQKIALVALVCVSAVFVVSTALYMTGFVAVGAGFAETGIFGALTVVLIVVFCGLSVYLLYNAFSTKVNLKKVLLYCDSKNSTAASHKVIKKIVDGCIKETYGVNVKKLRISEDDKQGFTLTLHVAVKPNGASKALDELRCMLQQSFVDNLGLSFNAIDFVVEKLSSKFTPDKNNAEVMADMLDEKRQACKECYDNPLGEAQQFCEENNVYAQNEQNQDENDEIQHENEQKSEVDEKSASNESETDL